MAVSGVSGTLVACLVIASIAIAPWFRHNGETSHPSNGDSHFPSVPPDLAPSPLVNVTLSDFIEPYGVDSEADLTLTVLSKCNISDVIIRIDIFPKEDSCISFVDDTSSQSWIVDLEADVPIVFMGRVKTIKTGLGEIRARAEWWEASWLGHIGKDRVHVSVWNDGILVRRGGSPLPVINIGISYPYLSELGGIGSQFNLSVFVFSFLDENIENENLTAQIILPEGLTLVNGNLTWNISPDTSTGFTVTLRAEKVGNWTIVIAAGKYLPEGTCFGNAKIYGVWWHGNTFIWGLSVFEDKVTTWAGDPSVSPFPSRIYYFRQDSEEPVWPAESPVMVKLLAGEFEPPKLGGEGKLTVILTSSMDVHDVTVRVNLPRGISLVSGRLIWNGDVEANVSTSFSLIVKACEVGRWNIAATANYYLTSGVWSRWYGDTGQLGIYISEDEISVVSGEFPPPDWGYRGVYKGSKIYFQPKYIIWTYPERDVNETFTVEVRVTNVEDLLSLEFSIEWDPTTLELIEILKGDFLDTPAISTWWCIADSGPGCVRMATYRRMGHVQGVNITEPDSGLVATITFKVLKTTNDTTIHFVKDVNFPTNWLNSITGIKTVGDIYDFEFMTSAHFTLKEQAS